MQDRIKEVRKHYKLTQTEFGERIGVKGNTVTGYETGLRTPSDAVIVSICREFNCNEIWLRTGEGDPFQEESRQEQIMRFATQTVNGSDEFKKAFVSMLAKMDADDWDNLAKLFRKLSGEIKKE
jgi:transcriptional regulator with XRE-family HTH domain